MRRRDRLLRYVLVAAVLLAGIAAAFTVGAVVPQRAVAPAGGIASGHAFVDGVSVGDAPISAQVNAQ